MLVRISLTAILLSLFITSMSCGPSPTDSEMFSEANQFQREGKYSQSIELYRKLIKKYPQSTYSPQAQFMIGFIYANYTGEIEKARTAYQKFLEVYPNHEMAKDARWELDHLGQDIDDIEELTKSNKGTSGE